MPPERLPYHRTSETADPVRVLIVDDEEAHADVVAETLRRAGFDCAVATSGQEGAQKIEHDDYDVILTDLRMDDLDGLAVVRKAKQFLPDAEVIVITGHGDVKTAVEAIKQGASNYLTKPLDMVELRAIVGKLGERRTLSRTNRELKKQLDEKFGFEGLIGNSPKMHEVINRLRSIAPTSATVLIRGENGTGKDLVAKAIHNNSPRKSKPFVALNCTALNENLIDDELFGHEQGSYTGADRMRKGRFEYANGGTLFLDEIGDMPLHLQAKLLRVLETQEVTRVGGNDPIKVNVRLVAATHRDLEASVADGKFRQDLYFRLKVVSIKLPSLRERREDIPLLTAHFIKEFNTRHHKHVNTVAEPVRRLLAAHDWPGNVRELRNIVESMVVQDSDGILGMDDLQETDSLKPASPGSPTTATTGVDGLVGRPLNEVERFYIEKALELTNSNREEASRMLGIGERTLYRVIQDWKLQDKIRNALNQADGNLEGAAKLLGITVPSLQRKAKKWGLVPGA